jgi:hypothetical protein
VDRLLAAAGGAARVVVGHTVQRGGRARARCRGRVVLLDTGMASEMADAPAAGWICAHSGGEGAGKGGDGGGGGGGEGDGAEQAREGRPRPRSAVLYADGRVQEV